MLVGCGALQQPQRAVPSGPMPQSTWVPTSLKSQSQTGWLSPAAKVHGRFLYVSQYYYGTCASCITASVLIYPEEGVRQSPIGRIPIQGPPWGIFVDKHKDLYVADQFGMVFMYRQNTMTPARTFFRGLVRPLYPVVDRSGDVFVSNAPYFYKRGGTVIEYPHGNPDFHKVLRTPGVEADGMGFDREGDLYVAFRNDSGVGSVEEFTPGSGKGKVLGMMLRQPQGLVVDNFGDIIVVETAPLNSSNQVGPHIDVFRPGEKTPSVEIPLPNDPNQIAIRRIEPKLFVAAEKGVVYGLGYPLDPQHHGIYVKETFSPPVIQGVALSNPQ